MTTRFGVDIGGSGIKGAVVDVDAGELDGERHRIKTPHPATPDAVAETVGAVVEHFGWSGPIGCTIPAVVKQGGHVASAANIDESWIGIDGNTLLSEATGHPVTVLNDADAAGLAEMKFGAARHDGVVMLLTLGTGIGSALFVDGILVPNTELGHLELDGHDAEKRAAASIRKVEDLSYPEWAERVDHYLLHVEKLFSPDQFVLGGGVSKKHEKWIPLLTVETEVVPAALRNFAGIIGAALAADPDTAAHRTAG